jgi:hypothetical protein
MTDAGGRRRTRGQRRHPARGARIVAAGTAAAAVLGITAALGFAQHATAAPGTDGSAVVTTPPPTGLRTTPPDVRPATPAPFGSAGAPDATTHGSR